MVAKIWAVASPRMRRREDSPGVGRRRSPSAGADRHGRTLGCTAVQDGSVLRGENGCRAVRHSVWGYPEMTASIHGSAQQEPLAEEVAFQLGVDA
jgi:hypothetical protein